MTSLTSDVRDGVILADVISAVGTSYVTDLISVNMVAVIYSSFGNSLSVLAYLKIHV